MIHITRKMILEQPQLQLLRQAIDQQVKASLVHESGAKSFYEERKLVDAEFPTNEGTLYVRYDYVAYGPIPGQPHITVSNMVLFESKEERDSLWPG